MYVCWFPIHLWFWKPALIDPSPVGSTYIGEAIIQISLPLIGLIASCFFRFRPVLTVVLIVCLFSLVLQLFSYIYWSYGSTQNFSIRLSHLDSFYFALGTLTTAGTGSISVVSETARGLQTLQMGPDLILVIFAVALVVARYSSLFDRRPRAEVRHDGTAAARPVPRQATGTLPAVPRPAIEAPVEVHLHFAA
jgi:Ion channel